MEKTANLYDKTITLCEGAITIFVNYHIGDKKGFHPYVHIERAINEQETRMCFDELKKEQRLYINLNNLECDPESEMQLNFIENDKPLEELSLIQLQQFKQANLFIENYEEVARAQNIIDLRYQF